MIWLYLGAFCAAIIFGIDYLIRRKGWSANTKLEKVSLMVNMLTLPIYLFFSAFGLLAGIVGSNFQSELLLAIYDFMLILGSFIWLISLIVVILSLILRKCGKLRLSIYINVFLLIFIALFLIFMIISGV